MGAGNRQQEYPYSLRTVLGSEMTMCLYRSFFYVVPPQDSLTIERLFCHINIEFDTSVAAADRRVEYIGITDEIPSAITATAHYQRRKAIGVSADAANRVDVAIDLSDLLQNDNALYRDTTLSGTAPTTGYTYVELVLPSSIGNNNNSGVIHLWKVDALYTTTGIR